MKKGAMVALLFIMLCSSAGAETYFIRNSGTASQSNAAQGNGGSCSSDSKAMSVSTHNSASFSPGDTIYICNALTQETEIRPPSSGSPGNYITYRGDYPGYPGSVAMDFDYPTVRYQMYMENRQYIRIMNLDFKSDGDDDTSHSRGAIGIVENGKQSGHMEISGCSFTLTTTGVYICGDTRNVDITRSTFRDMTDNGVGVFKCYGRETEKPSFITVGGSREDGNTFINIGREDNPTSGSVPGQVFGTRADDSVFSYNHVYADAAGWGTGVYLDGVDRVLVEHNFIHDLDAVHRRAPITFKTDFDWINTDVIIRYNKIGPTHGGETYTTPQAAIRTGHCLHNMIIYDNYITDVIGLGIFADWGWSEPGVSDGCIVENLYVFSNIVDRTETSSGIYFAGMGSGSDIFKNSYITNNLLNHISHDTTTHLDNTGINTIAGGDYHYDGLTILNNIIDTPRETSGDHIGIRATNQDDMTIDYNHHYFPGATPAVYYDNSDCKPCAWNSASRPAGYGTHDTEGDPLFTDSSDGDFTLKQDSPLRDTGTTITAHIPTLTIQGRQYPSSFSTALDPATDWSATIPYIVTADQDDHGEWEKGPYVYTGGGSTPTSACAMGQITSACRCGGSIYSSGYCCDDKWQAGSCTTTPACPQGQITSDCTCEEGAHSSGFCCNNEWQESSCISTVGVYKVIKTPIPPTIDGDIIEFDNAHEITITESTTGTIGRYRLMWDDDALYVAAEVDDAMLNADPAHQEDDGLWSDDAMEFMFDTLNNGGNIQQDDYKFFVNVNNVHADSRLYDASWDSGMTSHVHLDGTINDGSDSDSGYTIEARIPWANWATPSDGDVWGMNIQLDDMTSSDSYSTQWSDAGYGVNQPEGWVDAVFSPGSPCGNADIQPRDGTIDIGELIAFINRWKDGSAGISELIQTIGKWKGGC